MPEAPYLPPWHNSPMPTVAEFKIEYKRILDLQGALVAKPPAFATDYEEVRGMYRAMMRERLFDAGPWVGPEHPAHRYRNAFSAVPN